VDAYVVKRSAWRMWGVSILGVPMVVVALDMLTQRRLTNALRELLFRPDDTQLPEPRETVWAIALLVAGSLLCLWGLKELLAPSRMVVADASGLRLKVRGPFRPPWVLPWEQVDDLGSGTVEDEGDLLPVFWVRTAEPGLVPDNPWGARLLDDRTVAVLASDWEVSHVAAAESITDWALPVFAAIEGAPPGSGPAGAGHRPVGDPRVDGDAR
jgi:hypothetical protein